MLALAVLLFSTAFQTGVEELPLPVGESDGTLLAPPLGFVQSATHVEVVPITLGGIPSIGRGRQVTMAEEVFAILLDPTVESLPLAQQRFVGHFHGWCTRNLVSIEGQKSVAGEDFDHLLHGDDIDVESH
jgi:hypothetical protein